MNTQDMFYKIATWEQLSEQEKIQIAQESVENKDNGMPFAEILSGQEISIEEKITIARWLVADSVADILQKEMIISHVSGIPSNITLKQSECIDSDENLRKFLLILWAKDIHVSSDFPAYCESYEWTTTIKFKY